MSWLALPSDSSPGENAYQKTIVGASVLLRRLRASGPAYLPLASLLTQLDTARTSVQLLGRSGRRADGGSDNDEVGELHVAGIDLPKSGRVELGCWS